MIRRGIVMGIMTLSVLVIVTGTILFVLGYRLDSERGRLEQGALVQVDSLPSGASITIDDQDTKLRTPGKRTLVAGVHDFMVTRDGYQPWTKTLDLTAGTLTWLDYIRLVPKELKNETVASYASLYGEKASPDSRTLIVQERADTPTFQLVDLRSQDIKTAAVSLPATIYSDASVAGANHVFTLLEWDEGGRYVLVKHEFSSRAEWIVLDTQNIGASVNVSRLLSVNPSELMFAGTNGTVLYGLIDGVVRKLDLSAATLSRALISDVESFDVYDTSILTYVGADPNDGNKHVVGIYRDGDQSPHILRSAAREVPLRIDTAQYFSDDYVAISEGLQVSILKGRYPTSSTEQTNSLEPFASFTVNSPITQLDFSPGNDYLVTQTGFGFVGYELEYKRLTTASDVTSKDSVAPALQWLDDAYVWAVYDGSLLMREFDGTNAHFIGPAVNGFDAALTQNGRFLYSIAKDGETYHLQRVKMILD